MSDGRCLAVCFVRLQVSNLIHEAVAGGSTTFAVDMEMMRSRGAVIIKSVARSASVCAIMHFRKNVVRNGCPYRRCGVDTEILYRLFCLILCSGESVEAEFSPWFGGIQAVDTELPYQVPIVDMGTIAAPLLAAPVSDS